MNKLIIITTILFLISIGVQAYIMLKALREQNEDPEFNEEYQAFLRELEGKDK